MRALIALLLAIASTIVFAATPARQELGPYMKGYCGAEGINVWMVRIGPRANREVLVQIVGVDHPLDRRIIKAKIEPTNAGSRYTAEIDGKRVEIIRQDANGLELLIPGLPAVTLHYDKDIAQQVMPEHMLTAYSEQT